MKRVFARLLLGIVVGLICLVPAPGHTAGELEPPLFPFDDFGEAAPEFPLGRVVFASLVLGVVIWAVYPKPDFSIKLRQGRVRCRGRVPQAQTSPIAEFFRSEFDVDRTVRVSGRRLKYDRLTFRFGGRRSPQERQRIRNFLTLLLR